MQISKKTQRQASIAAISGLVVIGAASLFFKTFPHLNPFSCQSKKPDDAEGSSEETKQAEEAEAEAEAEAEEGVAITTEESAVLVDYDKLSYEELTALLKEKDIAVPADASLEDLANLAKGI